RAPSHCLASASRAPQVASGMAYKSNIAPARQETRPPAVLQVISSLVSGGVERGTVEVASALVAAGWTAYVASAGGPMERELTRAGAKHITPPLATQHTLRDLPQAGD